MHLLSWGDWMVIKIISGSFVFEEEYSDKTE